MPYHASMDRSDRSAILDALTALGGSDGHVARRFDATEQFDGRVVVLPSAFNPPTRAHLRMLELAAGVAGASHRAAMLTTRNVDKGLYGAPLDHRIGMLLAEAREAPGLAVVATNAARFVDQAAALTAEFREARFDFVAGYDTLVRIFDPRYYDDMDAALTPFFGRHRLLVTNRAEATPRALSAFVAALPARFRDRVLQLELDDHAAWMSSTAARENVAGGGEDESIPPAVRRYIEEHGLYRAGAAR